MANKKIRTRIAPSPTGDPHIGTAYTALFNFAYAKKNHGDFILRIEDTDQARKVVGSEEQIYEALQWLALEPDESPKNPGKFKPYKQSERLEVYKKFAQELIEKDAAYYCDCSSERLQKVREEQQAARQVPHYDGKCRDNPPKDLAKTVIRLKVPKAGETSFEDVIRGKISFQNSGIDDQVLVKSDGFPTYHLANVVDDHEMEITDVIRGEEWLSSTPKHVILYQAFGWELPTFAHLPLLRNPDKSKLSKRKNPVSILFYRKQGYLPEALLNFLALMGWSMPDEKEIFTLFEFIEKIDLKRVDPAGPVFDTQKLDWLNGQYIRQLSDEELTKRIIDGKHTRYTKDQVVKVLPLVKERLKKLSGFDTLTSYFFDDFEPQIDLLVKVSAHPKNEIRAILQDFCQILETHKTWDTDSLETEFKDQPEKHGWSKTNYFQTIRVVVTGSNQTPPLFDVIETLGREKVVARVKESISRL